VSRFPHIHIDKNESQIDIALKDAQLLYFGSHESTKPCPQQTPAITGTRLSAGNPQATLLGDWRPQTTGKNANAVPLSFTYALGFAMLHQTTLSIALVGSPPQQAHRNHQRVPNQSTQTKEVVVIRKRIAYRLAKSLSTLIATAICSTALVAGAEDVNERVTAAGQVFKELAGTPEGIPTSVLNKADCVVILPSVKKGGFIVGGQYGKGIMSCRSGANFTGKWGAPIMMQSSGGSFGLQAGGEATDFVVLVMNDEGARSVMKGRAKLGADASVAAGPVGRDAEASTTGTMQAQMLSYSRSKGVFGGVSLSGTSLGPDDGDNQKLYGKKVSGEQIFSGPVETPASATTLLSELETASPKNLSKGKH
jgi:lipid-binding SYLF domain-containing protein